MEATQCAYGLQGSLAVYRRMDGVWYGIRPKGQLAFDCTSVGSD
jgi:hypothetical protein